jgi:hypothetical protein
LFGTKKACGVYLWINNHPRDVRLSRTKKGGAILVGYMPEVCRHCTSEVQRLTVFQVKGKSSDDSSALANHHAQVCQTAYLQILRSAIIAAGQRQGFEFNDSSPALCRAIFNILIAIMDYEEVWVFR